MENDVKRNWFIQCKRYQKITIIDLKKIVDIILNKAKIAPNVLLVIITCNVTKITYENFKQYAIEQGIIDPKLWQATDLEMILYNDRPDLLFAYFGISLAIAEKQRTRESILKKCLSLKKNLLVILKKIEYFDWNACTPANLDLIQRVDKQEIIPRSIDDITYPEFNQDDEQVSWYICRFYGFYSNGLISFTY